MDETQHRAERGKPDPPVAHPLRAQPFFIEFEPAWRDIGNPLVQARDEEATNSGVYHDEDERDLIT
jgi:hypothetical protein